VEPPPLPTHVQLEVTGACNLRCRMCLVRYAPAVSRREGALSFEQYLAVVDALPDLRRLTLQGLGEPLLSPHLDAMVEHAARRGVAVGFNTNGVLLGRERADALVAAGLAWLHVSLDGATAETYEEIRHGTALAPRPGQFERVVANLRALVDARRTAGADAPRIVVVCVAMRRNVHELPALAELAADIGVDELWVQNLSHTFSDTDAAGDYAGIRAFAAEQALFSGDGRATPPPFAAARETAARHGLRLRLPDVEAADAPAAGEPGCTWPFEAAYVTHRGDVQPCCMVMGSDRARLGSLDEADFADIWHGPAYSAFRAALTSGDPPDVCRGCSLYRGVF
jgi:radical SAM protein with 4Fe4S-binding SPASM domain